MSPSNNPSRKQIAYQRLPGQFRGFFRRFSLWLGDDHLLFVDSARFSETYKRFYLRDVQSIIIRKSPRFVLPYYWVASALSAAVAILIAFQPFREWLFWPSVAVLSGIVVYLYIASMFQSCTCHLITRVNRIELPSLFRLRSARRFADVISPMITAAQGELPADWVQRSTTLEELSTAADLNPETPVDLLPLGKSSLVPVFVFALVLVDAAITFLQLRANDASAFSKIGVLNMVALAVCATIATVRLSRQQGIKGLRALVLAGLFTVAVSTYAGVTLQSIDRQLYHQTYANTLLYPGMRPLCIAEIVVDVAVAAIGLVMSLRLKQRPAKPRLSLLDNST